eukprot:19460-Heterococcus_DN1.PRE.3
MLHDVFAQRAISLLLLQCSHGNAALHTHTMLVAACHVRYHDIHHWYPDCNYGQYSMLWDHGEYSELVL